MDGGFRRGAVVTESSSGKREAEREKKRVGQIPCREQRQKNRLNVQRSQAEKLPPPVAKGWEKSELRERREKIKVVTAGRTEELLAFPFWACMKANDSGRAAETGRGFCRWSSQEWRAPEETKAILIGHWITIWLLHRDNSGVVLSAPKGQLQYIHVALLLFKTVWRCTTLVCRLLGLFLMGFMTNSDLGIYSAALSDCFGKENN